ncbi:MAG TPA: proteasome subunit beta [Candidatus Nanoarchaeia archaeon]|nr:proteasome subunit beta [Candidatus Nanoarchaeia archaeon]
MSIKEHTKKGTTTVGLVCKDGIILAADKRATLGGHIISNKNMDKVLKITDNMAFTTAGLVSDIQLITKLIKAELTLKRIRNNRETTVKEAANLLGSIMYQNIRQFSTIPGIVAFLLGGRDKSGFHLYELSPDGCVIEATDFAVDGSGMMMAWGVLDTLYKKDITVQDGVKLAVKAISAAMQRDAASGEGVDVFTITKEGVKKVLTKKLETTITV